MLSNKGKAIPMSLLTVNWHNSDTKYTSIQDSRSIALRADKCIDASSGKHGLREGTIS